MFLALVVCCDLDLADTMASRSVNRLDHPQEQFEALQNFRLKAKWQSVAIGCMQSL
jgi:hypothetical protein